MPADPTHFGDAFHPQRTWGSVGGQGGPFQ